MYLPPRFAETSLTKLHDLIDAYNFGMLFCQAGDEPPEVVHMPFILDRPDGANGAVTGHVAKANPVWRLFDGDRNVTVVFQGPHGYISPAWYRSRQDVPTWNYAVVHIQGKPQLLTEDGLITLLEALVKKHEGRRPAWEITEIGERLFEELRREIVGFKIPIERITAKFKLGQNRSIRDRLGAIEGLRRRGDVFDAQLAEMMSAAVSSQP